MKVLGYNNTSLFESALYPSGRFIIFDGCLCPPGWPSGTAGGVVASVRLELGLLPVQTFACSPCIYVGFFHGPQFPPTF